MLYLSLSARVMGEQDGDEIHGSRNGGFLHRSVGGMGRSYRKPLFGAIALRRNDLVFGMIWKGALYFKTDEQSVQDYDAADSDKLRYSDNGGNSHALKSYAEVPPDVIEDQDKLCMWAETAYQAALTLATRSK